MQVKTRGVLAAMTFAAALGGCYGGSADERAGSYATDGKPSSVGFTQPYEPGIAAIEAGNVAEARRTLNQLLANAPQDATAHYLTGLIQVADHDLKAGLASFEKAASLDVMMIAAHQQRGVLYARLGKKDAAGATLALLEARAAGCKNICAEAADLRAAIAAVSIALDRNAPLPAAAGSPLSGGAAADPPLRDARWLAEGIPITALAREPASCLTVPQDEKAALAVTVGRVAFRTPMLLGGQARQLGISCATCHRNGRANADFFFPGVSGAPGTADVTTSVLSSHRGDGIFNPKPIPDLAAPENKRLISRDLASGNLEAFIFGVVVKEFDGAEPPLRVLDGLSAYVRAISAGSCGKEQAVSLATHLDDILAARNAAVAVWAQGDGPTALLMIASARTGLAAIDERYASDALAADRRALRSADLGLEALQSAIEQGRSDIPVRLISWRLDMADWSAALKKGEAQSLYNPTVLAGKKGYRLSGL